MYQTMTRLAQALACATLLLLVFLSYHYYGKVKTLTYDNNQLTSELVLTRKSRDLALAVNTSSQSASLRNERRQVSNRKEHDEYKEALDKEGDVPLSANDVSILCKVYGSTSGVCNTTNVPAGRH